MKNSIGLCLKSPRMAYLWLSTRAFRIRGVMNNYPNSGIDLAQYVMFNLAVAVSCFGLLFHRWVHKPLTRRVLLLLSLLGLAAGVVRDYFWYDGLKERILQNARKVAASGGVVRVNGLLNLEMLIGWIVSTAQFAIFGLAAGFLVAGIRTKSRNGVLRGAAIACFAAALPALVNAAIAFCRDSNLFG